MKKPKFILRRVMNRTIAPSGRVMEHATWDIMRKWPGGEEFICEFAKEFGRLARRAVWALNQPAR